MHIKLGSIGLSTALGSKAKLAITAALIFGVLAGCRPYNYMGKDAPLPMSSVEPLTPSPEIALVLGAGGPRGYAHIGVMRALEEACIDIDLVVGTSVGSLLGVFWASGLSATEIDSLSTQGGPLTLFDPSVFADRGWVRGQRLQDYVNKELQGKQLEDLPRPVIVVATHRIEKTPRFFTQGNSGVAVRASSAVPGIISPVGINGVEFEDGDVSAPLSVSAARTSGAKFVIAVNVYPDVDSIPENANKNYRKQLLRRAKQIETEVAQADFVIHAKTDYAASPRRKFFVESRKIGEAEAKLRMPELLATLKEKGFTQNIDGCG